MRYLEATWYHKFADEPILCFHEVGENNWETRRVQLYRDGHRERADENHETARQVHPCSRGAGLIAKIARLILPGSDASAHDDGRATARQAADSACTSSTAVCLACLPARTSPIAGARNSAG
ncbi:DUF6881 domain-containing protein [Nocardia halotolerans]|uniref:DUF6881 domain-containing protein n=1 Tax=Nocardia halotolerans TaxID=1755878 RepID=A0ABV8VFM6_9NOCA